MKWTVVWLPTPQTDLTMHWVQADPQLRRRISGFVDAIESELSKRPENLGKLLPSGLREIIDLPTGLIFEVRAEDRLVRVIAFHVITPHDDS